MPYGSNVFLKALLSKGKKIFPQIYKPGFLLAPQESSPPAESRWAGPGADIDGDSFSGLGAPGESLGSQSPDKQPHIAMVSAQPPNAAQVVAVAICIQAYDSQVRKVSVIPPLLKIKIPLWPVWLSG